MLEYLVYGVGILGLFTLFLDTKSVPEGFRKIARYIMFLNLLFIVVIIVFVIINLGN